MLPRERACKEGGGVNLIKLRDENEALKRKVRQLPKIQADWDSLSGKYERSQQDVRSLRAIRSELVTIDELKDKAVAALEIQVLELTHRNRNKKAPWLAHTPLGGFGQ